MPRGFAVHSTPPTTIPGQTVLWPRPELDLSEVLLVEGAPVAISAGGFRVAQWNLHPQDRLPGEYAQTNERPTDPGGCVPEAAPRPKSRATLSTPSATRHWVPGIRA